MDNDETIRNMLELLIELNKTSPYMMTEIAVDGKNYIGTLGASEHDETGLAISGVFQPFLGRNFFEAFTVTPDSFTPIRIIDIDAPPGDLTVYKLLTNINYVEALTYKDIAKILIRLEYVLLEIQKCIHDFAELHKDKDVDICIETISNALKRYNFFKNFNNIGRIEKIKKVLKKIQYDVEVAVMLTLF